MNFFSLMRYIIHIMKYWNLYSTLPYYFRVRIWPCKTKLASFLPTSIMFLPLYSTLPYYFRVRIWPCKTKLASFLPTSIMFLPLCQKTGNNNRLQSKLSLYNSVLLICGIPMVTEVQYTWCGIG